MGTRSSEQMVAEPASLTQKDKERDQKYSKKLWQGYYFFYLKIPTPNLENRPSFGSRLRHIFGRPQAKEEINQYNCRFKNALVRLQILQVHEGREWSFPQKIRALIHFQFEDLHIHQPH